MFLRKRKSKKGISIDILAAYRGKNGKPTNKHIGTLGPFTTLDNPQLEDLIRKLSALTSSATDIR